MAHISDRCEELSSPNAFNFALSLFLLVGILVSYLPQHIRIVRRRSSEGLSPWFILLGATSGTCAIANILVLPTSQVDIACCRVNGPFACTAGLLGIAQIGVQWSCFFVITLLFLAFIPRYGANHRSGMDVPLEPTEAGLRQAILVVAACISHFIVVFLISVIFLARYPHHLGLWANILGISCAILASIQYVPQIWTTWRLQHIGSLSIPMMCIQTPGAFVFAASLAIRLGKSGWSAWAVYIVTGILQGCLLVMAITFELRDRKERRNAAWAESESGEPALGRPASLEYDGEDAALLRHRERQRVEPSIRDPADRLLTPHRLNADPDSSEGSNQSSRRTSQDGLLNEPSNLERGTRGKAAPRSSWFSSLKRQD